jgi:adiponectin receptor
MVGAVFFLILCITELMRASDMTDADFHHVHPVPSSMWLPLPSSYSFYLALVPLGGAITCLSSVLFHTIGCCSHAHYRKGMQCDGCGILATVFACQLFPIAVLWQCFPVERMVHLTVLSVLCVVSLVAVFLPQFSEFHFRKYRALLFLTTSIYWMASFVRLAYLVHRPHVNITDYPRDTEHLLLDIFGPGLPIALRVIIEDCSLGSLFIVAGALLVLSRVPERFFPGKLDLSWWSHPIWHLCTIMQSLSHYMLFRAFAVWWLSHDQARAMMCPEQ